MSERQFGHEYSVAYDDDNDIKDAVDAALWAFGNFKRVPNPNAVVSIIGDRSTRESLKIRRGLGRIAGAVLLGGNGIDASFMIAPQHSEHYDEMYGDLTTPPKTDAEIVLGADFFAANGGRSVREIMNKHRQLEGTPDTFSGNLMPFMGRAFENAAAMDKDELEALFGPENAKFAMRIARSARRYHEFFVDLADQLPKPGYGRPLIRRPQPFFARDSARYAGWAEEDYAADNARVRAELATAPQGRAVPEHLIRRAEAAKARAAGLPLPTYESARSDARIPQHLLARAQAAREKAAARATDAPAQAHGAIVNVEAKTTAPNPEAATLSTRIPEHLLKRAQAWRDALEARGANQPASKPTTHEVAIKADSPTVSSPSKIPEHLLQRSRSRRAALETRND